MCWPNVFIIVQFSIITPSFRASEWLKLCIASVADQEVEHEHIVQDSVSDDGTLEWLPNDPRVRAYIEKDRGMYDAVNRGLHKAKGEILAYINCDEQYLPGALKKVAEFFQANPQVDLVFADTIVIREDGNFHCFRKTQIPWAAHAQVSSLCTLTCAMFFRRSVLDKYNLYFSDEYRDLGDVDWVVRALKHKVPMKVLRHYTSAFTETGNNMNLKPNAMRERKVVFEKAPFWARNGKPMIEAAFKANRLLNGGLREKALNYAIYTKASPQERQTFVVTKPTPYWKRIPLASVPAA
jgi:glycosyltransferase involved in cell wall biosynthesis